MLQAVKFFCWNLFFCDVCRAWFFFTSFLFFWQKVDSGKVGVILIGLVKEFVLRISYVEFLQNKKANNTLSGQSVGQG